MNVAISIYGDQTITKKQYPEAVYFTYSYSEVSSTVFHQLNSEHQAVRRIKLHDYCCNELTKLITQHETDNNIVFDVVVFMPANTFLVCLPTLKGRYYAPYYCMANMSFMNPIPCIEIVSRKTIRINGGRVISLCSADIDCRKLIFNVLFDGKVVDFETFAEEKQNLVSVFIPSVINTSSNPFDYSSFRSVFSAEERLQQTINQLRSIVKATCYLLEGSSLDLDQLSRLVKEIPLGKIVLFSKDDDGNRYANTHINKSVYEIYVMQQMIQIVKSKWYIKFGGRYRMSPSFCMSNLLKQVPVYKIIDDKYAYGKKSIVECILYSFPQEYLDVYKNIYEHCRNDIDNTSSEGIENLLYKYSKDYERIDMLNVEGYDAIEGFYNHV